MLPHVPWNSLRNGHLEYVPWTELLYRWQCATGMSSGAAGLYLTRILEVMQQRPTVSGSTFGTTAVYDTRADADVFVSISLLTHF